MNKNSGNKNDGLKNDGHQNNGHKNIRIDITVIGAAVEDLKILTFVLEFISKVQNPKFEAYYI